VSTAPDGGVSLGLVRVEALDAAPLEGRDQFRAKIGGQRRENGGRCRDQVVERYVPWKVGRVEPRQGGGGHMFGRLDEHSFAVKRTGKG
jgi:hypothetical protein